MRGGSSDQFSGIFVCYRREDASGHAGRLFDRLAAHFGKDRIFMDIDTIDYGLDFQNVIEDAVGSCEILLAIIGRHWLTISDGKSRRLDRPDDFIRLEIVAALNRDIRVIPVLVQSATMPQTDDLPDDMVRLTRRQAIELGETGFHDDVNGLIKTIERVLSQKGDRYKPRQQTRRVATRNSSRAMLIAAAITLGMIALGLAIWAFSTLLINNKSPKSEVLNNPPTLPTQTPRKLAPAKEKDGRMQNGLGMDFVEIPPGAFSMGADPDQHKVTITYSFYIGKFEVTQDQYESLVGVNPSAHKGCAKCPVENVSWNDAGVFISILNQSGDGFEYRLPTEAEWEYACHFGIKVDYPRNKKGDEDAERDLKEQAWFENNSGVTTHESGGKKLNGMGLADMLGNVWEWCQDNWHSGYADAPRDGSPWMGGEQGYRVIRGGAFDTVLGTNNPRFRTRDIPSTRDRNKGFRLVAQKQIR